MPPADGARSPRWDPALYTRFASERERPALDLIARIPLVAPKAIADLGCGTGNVTARLFERWPKAAVTGIDNAPAMLAEARARPERALTWVEADIAAWVPGQPPDLIFSNAALQWLGDHARLFPGLLGMLAPGGVLAVQMPANQDAPSHRLMAECARAGGWAKRLVPLLREAPVAPPTYYYDLLAPAAAAIDIWETEYLQVLNGDDPVVTFVRGTGLKPLIDALAPPERAEFLALYARRVREAYPRRGDGTTLFPFRRLFMVVRARGG